MNIFFLSWNVYFCSQWHCDKHCVKMILEYAQLLSTAHRVLDGNECIKLSEKGRKLKRHILNDFRENKLYKSTHINHPSAKWVRESSNNYIWLYNLFCRLCDEYTYRYNKVHLTDAKLRYVLEKIPNCIYIGELTLPPQAMPDEYKDIDPIKGYRNYYLGDKKRMLKWTNRKIPNWVLTNFP